MKNEVRDGLGEEEAFEPNPERRKGVVFWSGRNSQCKGPEAVQSLTGTSAAGRDAGYLKGCLRWALSVTGGHYFPVRLAGDLRSLSHTGT